MTRPAAVLLSHAHLDHWGLVSKLPADWPVHCGEATARLIAALPFAATPLPHRIATWNSRSGPIRIGRFSVTPFLTDHSAFDAYMLLVDGAGRRILYTGDFRRHGRKAVLVDRLMANAPENIDILITEGTNLGTTKPTVSETALEDRLLDRIRSVRGRVFVAWSGQNIDRTVTLYRAAKRTGRDLIVDLYTADILNQIDVSGHVPRPGWPHLKVVFTRHLARKYESIRGKEYLQQLRRCGIGAARLEGRTAIVMLRQGLAADYAKKGVRPTPEDLFLWSMWDGYLARGDAAWQWCHEAGTPTERLHTSGHASAADLIAFAAAMAPRAIVPVHGTSWDEAPAALGPLLRLTDGEPHALA